MAPPPDLPVATATVCLTCGDKGETKRLIYCRNCRDSAVHHYCMQNFSPDDDNINWWCWDCEPKDVNAEPSRKSERISSKDKKPVSAPIRRGWLNIKEQSETCVQILAHLSSKACLKVSDAANGMPPMLDVQLLDRHAIWPKSFRITPPTTASIALYFFPASERDERVYDSLLDAVIEKELALKVMINDIELLIFSSCELPLQNWRYNSKYYLWGVFRKNHRANSSSKDIVLSQCADDPYQPSQSPLSIKSSQASNIYPLSKNNTPDSLACPSFPLQAGQDSGTR